MSASEPFLAKLEQEIAGLDTFRLLVGGLAHDFNNLLTAIVGHASLIEADAEPGSEIRESSAAILKAAERAAIISEKLQGIARPGKRRREPVDLHEIIAEVLSLLKPATHGNIEIVHRYDTPSAWVAADPSQICHVVLNLTLNAFGAMPDGGRLIFETGVEELDSDEATDCFTPKSGAHVRLSVRDTGCGIAQEDHQRIFEPYFTKRSSGAGTGLGLTVVARIVGRHDGHIRVESEVGRGSAFHVYLPRFDGAGS